MSEEWVSENGSSDVHTTVVPFSWESDGWYTLRIDGLTFDVMRCAGMPATASDMAKDFAAKAREAGVDVVRVEGPAIMWRPRT